MKLMILAGFLIVLGVTGLLICTLVRVHSYNSSDEVDYGVILDAGSTSTRAYIFQWSHKTSLQLPFITMALSDKHKPYTAEIHPGLASLSNNATEVHNYLLPLLEWAHDKIPEKTASVTPIFLRGTGGLRELPEPQSSALLTAVRYTLQESNFYFENSYASILPGFFEAAYGFISVNALYNNFDTPNPASLYGSLDMGGASAEIAFISADEPPVNNTFDTTINGTAYKIYVQSQDGLGINDARYLFNVSLAHNVPVGGVVYDPCLPYGYSENVSTNSGPRYFTLVGTSSDTQCATQVSTLVSGLTGTLPTPPVTGTFIAFDKYNKLKDFYALTDNANIAELQAKVSSFCRLSLEDALSHHPGYGATIQEYCFTGMYVVTLLSDFYKFDSGSRHILWMDSVKKYPISWALGAMIDHVTSLTPSDSVLTHHHVRLFHTDTGVVLVLISIMLIILGLVVLAVHSHKKRHPDYVEIVQ